MHEASAKCMIEDYLSHKCKILHRESTRTKLDFLNSKHSWKMWGNKKKKCVKKISFHEKLRQQTLHVRRFRCRRHFFPVNANVPSLYVKTTNNVWCSCVVFQTLPKLKNGSHYAWLFMWIIKKKELIPMISIGL